MNITMMSSTRETASITGRRTLTMPALLLHAEGVAVFIAAIAAYAHTHGNGWAFALLLLVPDLGMIGYLKNVRLGAITYNAVHTYIAPALLMAFALAGGWTVGAHLALIWFAHIGMDRMFGFGLKYPTEFKDTHMGRI